MFEIKDDFYMDGQPFKIISGAVHYFRTLPEYWRDRLEKLVNIGCNTVETYIPWNFHEPKQGEFIWSGMRDIVRFIETAQELGLYIIIRPSPYICAEWEFGGLPAWLLKDPKMRLRCSYEPYLRAVKDYYSVLMPKLAPYQTDRGGKIILMQIENEYGYYGNDTAYLEFLRDTMRELGITVPFVTSDGPWSEPVFKSGMVGGALPTGNFGSAAEWQFGEMKRFIGEDKPLMCMEFWNGWFDAWGEEHHTTEPEKAARELDELLKRGSVNFYMFEGGTNFGFMAGRNGGRRPSASVCSMAGRMRLHTLAAVITPAAKPSSAPCARSHTLRAKKNTVAAPSAVIRNVKDVPSRASISGRSISVHRLYGLSGGKAPVCQYRRQE